MIPDRQTIEQQCIVILKPMFTLQDMTDLAYEQELKQDILDEVGQSIGEVEHITVFPHNPEGVVEHRFKRAESAARCIEVMQGRYFSGRMLECSLWDGSTNYN
jgi:HIV Tat-specific factor 1